MRIAVIALALGQLVWTFSYPASADPIDPNRGFFAASRSWFQLGGDAAQNLYRSYAGLVIDDKLVDFPNLFVMNCRTDADPYLTLHFPENYAFNGFQSDTWLPKTGIAVRISGSTFSFDAELNKNEFYVDLAEQEFDYLHDIWAANGQVEFKLGPAGSDVRLGFGQFDDLTSGVLKQIGRKIVGVYSYLQMRTRCHAASLAAKDKPGWTVFGSIACPTCDGSNGKPYMFITADRSKDGKPIDSKRECERIKSQMDASFARQVTSSAPTASYLFCIGKGEWR